MLRTTRRAFLRVLAAVLSVLALPRWVWARLVGQLDRDQLSAIGHVILPSELGAEGKERVVGGFEEWLEGFRPEAELPHGFGTAEIRRGPPDPTPRWVEQLGELDDLATRRHGATFRELPEEGRIALLRERIADDRLALQSPAQARHVAMGLLAFFYRSPEATNLCYRAAIDSESCRELSAAGEKPAPLQPGR
jgi:hypothetical protein